MKKTDENGAKSDAESAIAKEMAAYNRKLKKVIRLKEKKFGIKYDDVSENYKSYCLYRSPTICSYQQYRHFASFNGYPILSKAELFKNYQLSFEVKTDMVLSQPNPPSREGYAKNIPESSSKWSDKELKALRDYVLGWVDPFKKSRKTETDRR